MALLMFREEVSSAPPAWTELGALKEQSGRDLRWFERHIIVTHESCTFFSQSCLDLLRVLGTMMVLAKVVNTSFLFFSIPPRHTMRSHIAAQQDPTAAARLFDGTRYTHQEPCTPLDNIHSTYRRRRLPTTTRTAPRHAQSPPPPGLRRRFPYGGAWVARPRPATAAAADSVTPTTARVTAGAEVAGATGRRWQGRQRGRRPSHPHHDCSGSPRVSRGGGDRTAPQRRPNRGCMGGGGSRSGSGRTAAAAA